jgi:hypothetical protein
MDMGKGYRRVGDRRDASGWEGRSGEEDLARFPVSECLCLGYGERPSSSLRVEPLL